MDIIDSDGKIFRILNIIDAIIILFFIALLTTFFVYVYIPPHVNEHESVIFQIYLNSDYFLHPLTYASTQPLFIPGTEIYSSIYNDKAEIIDAKIVPLRTNSDQVKMIVTLNGTLSKGSDNQYLFNGYQISPGMVFPFQINDSYFISVVQRVNYSHNTTKKKVLLTLKELPSSYDIGAPLFDLAGNPVGSLITIYSHDASYYALVLLEVDQYEDGLYFQDIPLKNNFVLTLFTSQSLLNCQIV